MSVNGQTLEDSRGNRGNWQQCIILSPRSAKADYFYLQYSHG